MRRKTIVLLGLVGILLAGSHYGWASQEEKSKHTIEPFDDVRSKNLSKLDLSSRKGLIATLQYNQQTVWPEQAKMPPGSDPGKILADAMNPGLGIRQLHQQGITGKGINVAIIDQPLLPDHPEYDGKIAAYFDTGCGPSESSMHGPAVASLLVGTNCGTAPDARVYYVAAPSWSADTAYYAKGLEWIIAQNKKLPEANKIRVVSVSARPSGLGSPFKKNQEKWDEARARAEADGIMVLDCTRHRGFIRQCWYDIKDTERVDKCTPGEPKGGLHVNPADIHVPASCRTTAQHFDFHGRNSYIYWGQGGTSWSIPYCAGVLAMGWQIRPDLTPAQMKEMLFASAHVHKSGAKIIDPRAFIDLIRKQSDNQASDRSSSKDVSALVRKAAAEGRISFKRTTPKDFTEIAGEIGTGAAFVHFRLTQYEVTSHEESSNSTIRFRRNSPCRLPLRMGKSTGETEGHKAQ
ncbi:MAG: hypothetical protein JSW47_11745 [Phycisphaerales bacterium]|nr:MAG: hypothetical protein JSW47_11745 [Phycisphaerales bacterium]